jgi:parallel beta-helix repeat protein
MADPDHATEPAAPSRGVLAVLGAVALALVSLGWFLPLWVATLYAPQYPGGLTMRAYGHDVTGDVDEISGLNHYVGMRPFDLADFPEIALWPFALAGAAVAVVLALLVGRPWLRRLGLVYLWGTPIGVLAVIQLRLYQYGQDLDPNAALRLDPFTPLVVGPTKVFNFTTWSWPGLGLVAIVLAAAVVTFGPWLARRVAARSTAGVAAVVAIGAMALVALPAPAVAATDDLVARTADRHASTVSYDDADGDLADLLARAGPGERVVVPPGTFRGNVVIDVPVVLVGRGLPTIVGDGTGTVLTIRAPGTVVRNLAVRGSGPGPTGSPAGIRVEADDVEVEGVVVEDSYMGIAVESAEGIRLVGNTVRGRQGAAIVDESHAVEHERDPAAGSAATSDHDDHRAAGATARSRGDGIWLHDVEHVLVRGNLVESARDGVYVNFGSGTLIDGNVVRDSRYAVHSMFAEDLTLIENHVHDNLSGAVLMYGGPALLLRNHIEHNASASTGFAVLLKDVIEVEAVENLVIGNRVGLHVDGPPGADTPSVVAANTVAGNTIGVSAYSSARAVFRANSFVDNTVQVLPQGGRLHGLVWSDKGWGNLWSTYRGYEGRAQGRGAVPHAEGGGVDRLLGRNPELLAIADAPALRLLRSVEERWGRQDPVLTDELPIVAPLSPAVPTAASEPAARTVGLVVGTVLVAPFLLLLAWRPRRLTPSRSLHALPA